MYGKSWVQSLLGTQILSLSCAHHILITEAAGYKQIPMTVIKESILLVSKPFAHMHIINLSIQHGIHPRRPTAPGSSRMHGVPEEMKIILLT